MYVLLSSHSALLCHTSSLAICAPFVQFMRTMRTKTKMKLSQILIWMIENDEKKKHSQTNLKSTVLVGVCSPSCLRLSSHYSRFASTVMAEWSEVVVARATALYSMHYRTEISSKRWSSMWKCRFSIVWFSFHRLPRFSHYVNETKRSEK